MNVVNILKKKLNDVLKHLLLDDLTDPTEINLKKIIEARIHQIRRIKISKKKWIKKSLESFEILLKGNYVNIDDALIWREPHRLDC